MARVVFPGISALVCGIGLVLGFPISGFCGESSFLDKRMEGAQYVTVARASLSMDGAVMVFFDDEKLVPIFRLNFSPPRKGTQGGPRVFVQDLASDTVQRSVLVEERSALEGRLIALLERSTELFSERNLQSALAVLKERPSDYYVMAGRFSLTKKVPEVR